MSGLVIRRGETHTWGRVGVEHGYVARREGGEWVLSLIDEAGRWSEIRRFARREDAERAGADALALRITRRSA